MTDTPCMLFFDSSSFIHFNFLDVLILITTVNYIVYFVNWCNVMLFREHVYFLCVLPQLGNKQSPSIWKTLRRRGTGNGEQGTSTEKDKWKIRSKVNKANLNSSAISKFLYYALFCSHLSFPVSRVTFPSKITTSK